MTSRSFACVAVPAPITQLLGKQPVYRLHQTLIVVISKLHHGPRHVSCKADVRFKLLSAAGGSENPPVPTLWRSRKWSTEFLIRGSSPETPRSARTISCHTHVDHFGTRQEYGLSQYVLSFCDPRILAAHPLLPISLPVSSTNDSSSLLPSMWTSV